MTSKKPNEIVLILSGPVQVIECIDTQDRSRGYLTGIGTDINRIRITFANDNPSVEIEGNERNTSS